MRKERIVIGRDLNDKEIDLLVQSFLLPPPFGFTETEKKQILDWITDRSSFIRFAEKRIPREK